MTSSSLRILFRISLPLVLLAILGSTFSRTTSLVEPASTPMAAGFSRLMAKDEVINRSQKAGLNYCSQRANLLPALADMCVNTTQQYNYLSSQSEAARSAGIEYLPMQWGCGLTSNSWDTVDAEGLKVFAGANRGSRWLIFVKPDMSSHANCPPETAAEVYHTVHQAIKEADPSAKLYCCGTGAWPNHREWHASFASAYQSQYGTLPPIDGMQIYVYGYGGDFNTY